MAVVEEILLAGKEFPMGYRLSDLRIYKRKVDPNHAKIDFNASLKYKQELIDEGKELFNKETGKGVQWLIYMQDTTFYQLRWEKALCTVKNKTAYRFDTTRGVKGNKKKITDLINSDPLAFTRFIPYNGHIRNS